MKPLRIEMTRDSESGRAGIPAADAQLARRILIVEDNYFVAHQCESALVEAGYDVVDIVETADQAVQAALDRRPALVLMSSHNRWRGSPSPSTIASSWRRSNPRSTK